MRYPRDMAWLVALACLLPSHVMPWHVFVFVIVLSCLSFFAFWLLSWFCLFVVAFFVSFCCILFIQ